MANIAEIRQQYPQYSDLSDQQLADGLRSKFYADMPVDQFYSKIGLNTSATTAAEAQPGSEEADFLAAVNSRQQVKDGLKNRSTILPVSRTKEGELTPSVPGIVKDTIDTGRGATQAVMDLLSGKITADQISGKEMAQIIGTLGIVPTLAESPAAGTGAAIARQATQRAAPEAAESAAARAVPEVAGATKAGDFKTAAKGFYKQVDDSGTTISGKALRPVIDDIVASSMVHPALTSVSLPKELTGRAGVDMLLTLMENPDRAGSTRRELPAHLMVRGSTGPSSRK